MSCPTKQYGPGITNIGPGRGQQSVGRVNSRLSLGANAYGRSTDEYDTTPFYVILQNRRRSFK